MPIFLFGLTLPTICNPTFSNERSKIKIPATDANDNKNPTSNISAGRTKRIAIAASESDDTSSFFLENADENIYTPLIITARNDDAVNEQSIEYKKVQTSTIAKLIFGFTLSFFSTKYIAVASVETCRPLTASTWASPLDFTSSYMPESMPDLSPSTNACTIDAVLSSRFWCNMRLIRTCKLSGKFS